MTLSDALNIADLRSMSKRRLPKGVYAFIERGAEDDSAVARNRAAFGQYTLRPRVLRDISRRTTGTTLFGKPLDMPVVISPTGAAGIVWHDGERALALAAAQQNIPFTLSTTSLTSIEKIADVSQGRLWFQLYMLPEFSMTTELVSRACNAGFEALVVTVDTAVTPKREHYVRNGFALPFRLNRRNALDMLLHCPWLISVMGRYLATGGMPAFENYPAALQQDLRGKSVNRGKAGMPKTETMTWENFAMLRRKWSGPLLVKGILHPEDAALAVKHGADGIVVSNHGGRNLDTAITPLDALGPIAEAVQSRATILVDGAVQRGSDIAKALALGADAVMVGRTPLWGLGAAGQAGATRALDILQEELFRVLGQLGCVNIAELDRSVLFTKVATGRPSNICSQ